MITIGTTFPPQGRFLSPVQQRKKVETVEALATLHIHQKDTRRAVRMGPICGDDDSPVHPHAALSDQKATEHGLTLARQLSCSALYVIEQRAESSTNVQPGELDSECNPLRTGCLTGTPTLMMRGIFLCAPSEKESWKYLTFSQRMILV